MYKHWFECTTYKYDTQFMYLLFPEPESNGHKWLSNQPGWDEQQGKIHKRVVEQNIYRTRAIITRSWLETAPNY